jgi:branched-chain amino acid transport system permease protein
VSLEQFASVVPQSIVNGLMLGGTLALVALGFSIVWGILNIINLAHGAYLMLAAYFAYFMFTGLGIDPFISLVPAMLIFFGLGYLVQRLIINNVVRAPLLVTFLLTFGLEIILVNLALNRFGGDYRSITTAYSGLGFSLGDVKVTYIKLAALLISVLITSMLHLFLSRTRTGNAIRAVGMDIDAARLCGVRIGQTYAITYGLGAALAAAAGVLIGMSFPITPDMGGAFNLRSFVIVVLGGLGSVPGALVGGIIFGMVDAFAGVVVPGLKDAVAFATLVLVLIVRPQGILGKAFYK